MIEQLPQEITTLIAIKLNQNDLIRLSQTCSAAYMISQPLLYNSIVIDSSKKVYSSDVSYSLVDATGTQISSLFALNLFFKRDHHHHIRSIKFCEQIPDLYDGELLEQIGRLLGNCHFLQEFYWLNESLKLPTGMFRSTAFLTTLKGNLLIDSNISLPNIKELSLGNLNENFEAMGGLLSGNKLDKLCLYNNSLIDDIEPNKLQINCRLDLSELVLKNVTLTSKDAHQLKKCVNMRNLRTLKLINCVESVYDVENNIKRLKRDKYIWEIIGGELSGLQQLQISNSHLVWHKFLKFISKTRLRHLHLSMDCEIERKQYLNRILGSINAAELHTLVLDTPSNEMKQLMNSLSSYKNLRTLQLKIGKNEISNVLLYLNSPVSHFIIKIVEKSNPHQAKFGTLINREYFNYYECIRPRQASLIQQFENYFLDFKSKLHKLKTFQVVYNKQRYLYNVEKQCRTT